MNDHNDASGIATIQDPWQPDELRERVTRGEAVYCVDCQTLEGFPWFGGRCPACDYEEFVCGMPPTGREDITTAIRRALGYQSAERLPYHMWYSRDASRWDSREYRGWRGFRIHLITMLRGAFPQRALPNLWTMTPDELPDGVQGTRLKLVSESAHTATDLVVIRALLWRVGEAGYLRGYWDGQLHGEHPSQRPRFQWDICDAAEIAPAQREVWWAAIREARKRGPKLGSRKCFESYEAFELACRDLVTADGWKAALKPPRTSTDEKARMWEAIVAGKITQVTLVKAFNVSQPALSRALKEYERSHGLTWRDWQRRIASWAKQSGEAADKNY